MKTSQLASLPNLELAWRRITTGANYQYKEFYRPLYFAYEVALKKNLQDLRQRLIGGAFQPTNPDWIYLPKPSGLHRPLALLNIEDQIVLQAFANVAARKLQKRRGILQFSVVFSNILEKPDSIFFFRKWQETYRAFQKQISKNYEAGFHWVGDFDLAAFYDTISHELLIKTLFPRTTNEGLGFIRKCFRTWSSNRPASDHDHGIPQGPLASDFLAECFLTPIDEAMTKRGGYLRYVDDVRLLGPSEDEVRASLIELERHCRERGLIPQTGKFAIKHARDEQDAMGMLPSIADPHRAGGSETLPIREARTVFRSAISGRPYRVQDKTRLRYVLFRAEADAEILGLVIRLLPRHPEHADLFFDYFSRFGYRRPIEDLCMHLIERSPYPYVRGEAWHVAARYLRNPRSKVRRDRVAMAQQAIAIAKNKRPDNFAERWGVCHFLCASERESGSKHSRFLKYQESLLQALVGPVLPKAAFETGGAAASFLQRSAPEPGLSIASALHAKGLPPSKLGLKVAALPSQLQNVLAELGLTSGLPARVDPIAEILESRYGVPRADWRTLLAGEYIHALGLLKQAEAAFASGPSFWLATQNSFNQAIFLALQQQLQTTGHPAACKTVNKKGELINFGVTLDANGPFSRNEPVIGGCFREMNARRNALPPAHPYEKGTAAQTTYLKATERNRFVSLLRKAYADFTLLMP